MERTRLRTPLGLLQESYYGVTKMAQIQHKPSNLPPRKQRDPNLARSKDELLQKQEEYIGEIVKSVARESLRQGTVSPNSGFRTCFQSSLFCHYLGTIV